MCLLTNSNWWQNGCCLLMMMINFWRLSLCFWLGLPNRFSILGMLRGAWRSRCPRVLLRQCGQGAVLLACCLSSAQHVGEVPVVQGTHLWVWLFGAFAKLHFLLMWYCQGHLLWTGSCLTSNSFEILFVPECSTVAGGPSRCRILWVTFSGSAAGPSPSLGSVCFCTTVAELSNCTGCCDLQGTRASGC